jgi:hypothetical protein
MTRHGTLAYYLAAWVIGCPVVALVFWLIESVQTGSASSSALLEICFFALMSGALDSLLFAFLLRRMMHGFGTRNAAAWSLVGAALAFVLVFALSWIFSKLPGSMQQGPGYFVRSFAFAGPEAIWRSGWWQAPIEGGGIAAVLCLVDRAFNPDQSKSGGRVDTAETGALADKPEAAPAGQSPA